MTDPHDASPALARIRAAHDAWAALGADPAPRAQVLATLTGRDDDREARVDAVAPGARALDAAAFRQLHMASHAEAHVKARAGGPPGEAQLRGPDGAIDLAAYDRLSWEVFELEAAVRALPLAWPSRGSLAGVAAAWRAPQEALRAEAARGHVRAVLGRRGGDPLAALAAIGFWAPKLAPDAALAADVADFARDAVEGLLAELAGPGPDLAAWRPRGQAAPDDAELRAFEDAGPRRARVLAERLGDPRQSGAWGTEVARTAWRDRAEAAAAELEGPLGSLALDWAEAVLAGLAAPITRVLEWLQRVPDGDPRLPALLARCEALDGEASRMWRDRRMAVIRERIARPGAPSIADA